MNSHEAKKLNLPEIMLRLGYQPISVKKGGNEYWYNSPFRKEKDASFHTSFLGGKWIWNDFADRGGTVIDFIMRHENYTSVSDALAFLENMFGKAGMQSKSQPQFFFQQPTSQKQNPNADRELEFLSTKPIENPLIISYLTELRGINKQIALQYLEEVRYINLNNGKEYFAFGIRNESEGYEIRVASDKYPFKSALKKKDISYIKGTATNGEVNIFEGMTDFLALLTLEKKLNLEGDTIIMHSLATFERTVDFVKSNGYSSINTYLDNDRPGREFNSKFKAEFGDSMDSKSGLFGAYKDLADMVQHSMKGNLKKGFGRY